MKRLLWFRRDLRVEDNRLLALEGTVLPIFIFDPALLEPLERDDRRVGMILEGVLALKTALRERGLELALFHGDPERVIAALQARYGFDEVAASGDYDAHARDRDLRVSHILPFRFEHDTYIFRPDEVLKNDGTPYLVFTPFYKRAKTLFRRAHLEAVPPASQRLLAFEYDGLHRIGGEGEITVEPTLEALGFVPSKTPHRLEPEACLEAFETRISRYDERRDFPAEAATSELGPELRFGTLGVRQLLRWLAERKKEGVDTEPFFRQLIFRDFYAYLLYHLPRLETENFRYPFSGEPDDALFERFCRGETGVPMVDAGVRELVETGKMHNRVRMVCASFLTKDLLLPWQWGERFFARHLLDYDAASNVLSWQWASGTGVDPQPYFRIFNPWKQGERFDRDGGYIRTWVSELAEVEAKRLHDERFFASGGVPGYPRPVVDHKAASQRAQAYFKTLLGRSS